MKYICINLESSKKRKEFMQSQFKNNNINCDFFKAVDGRKLSVKDFYDKGYITENLYNEYKETKINISTRSFACAFSHLLIWKSFLEEKNPKDKYLMVFEDDLQIVPDFKKSLNEYITHLPPNWDFLYFDYNIFVGKKLNKYWNIPKNNAGKGKNAFLSCYIINRSGCKKLLDLMFPYKKNRAIDSIMRRNFDKFNAYFSNKHLGYQNKKFPSDRV